MARVRVAEPADASAIVDLTAEVAAEGRWLGAEPGFDRTARAEGLFAAIQAEDRSFFVADSRDTEANGAAEHAEADGTAEDTEADSRRSGRIAGWIHVGHAYRGLYDLSMAVAEADRGRGIGTSLVRAGLGWLESRGAHKVSLEVWPHNQAAIALYRRFGFEIEGRRRRHWRRANGELWDSLIMGLGLDPDRPGSPHPDADAVSAPQPEETWT